MINVFGVSAKRILLLASLYINIISLSILSRQYFTPNITQTQPDNYSKYAIAIKTGIELYLERVPLTFMTIWHDFVNKILIGEATDFRMGNVELIDVYSNSSNHIYALKSNSNDSSELGWMSDADKFLPGLKALYNKFPNAEWYVMVDDDTYIFKDNLDLFLSNINSSLPHYMGSVNHFSSVYIIKHSKIQCGTNYPKINDSLRHSFAHGGAGILINNKAMTMLLPALDECLNEQENYNCIFGDVRLSLCFQTVGIYLENCPASFPVTPLDLGFTLDPCMMPVSYHHLTLGHIQGLFEIETEIKSTFRKGYVTHSDVMALFWPWNGDYAIETGVNRPGSDIRIFKVNNIIDCRLQCQEDPECKSFTFDENDLMCSIKSSIPTGYLKNGTHSGIIKSRYVCEARWID